MSPEQAVKQRLFDVIVFSLWGKGNAEADEQVFEEMQAHSIVALPAKALSSLSLPSDLFALWKNAIYTQIQSNVNCRHEQAMLPITAPYTILKGTSAAGYYPYPEYRSLGDIDIMTGREDYAAVCDMLIRAGYVENTLLPVNGIVRHRGFERNGIEVEVHAYFARLNDPEAAKYLDDLIIANINPAHVLPDPVNGLVILEHISQHLEEGLGLRHIIDWMMFVDKCLPEGSWQDFKQMTEKIGMTRLAIVLTRMCELYLGLSEHGWCREADAKLCEKLMDYLLECGNFGRKMENDRFSSERVLGIARSPLSLFRLLQRHGLNNWDAGRRYPVLKPFAWMYQILRYIKKGLFRRNFATRLKSEYAASRDRNALFKALGVAQYRNTHVVYKNGAYVKETIK